MAIEFSPVVAAHEKRIGDAFSARSVDLGALGDATSPVLVLDHFRIDAPVFGPHPHAGFSAVSYVLEDSPGALRSRDTPAMTSSWVRAGSSGARPEKA